MSQIDRRTLLGAGGALLAGATLAACGGSSEPPTVPGGGGGGGGDLRWWDHFSALQKFHKSWAAEQSQALGVEIAYTYNDVSKSAEALQLANQSKQLPDVYSNVLGLPLAALVEEGWLHELSLTPEATATLPEGALTEGVTSLGGKVYGLPLFAAQQYSALTWFNTDIIGDAGLDPDAPPTSYDAFRAACAKIKSSAGGDHAPMVLALGGIARMGEQIDDMVMAGGFEGFQGLRFATGEYAYDDDAYVNAIEFWKQLNDDGFIVQGASNFTVANARSRWSAGVAGFFPDGPWCAGGVKAITPAFVPTMGVGPILTAESGATPVLYRGAPGAQFFVAGNSRDPEKASALLSSFLTTEYQKGLASGMDQPPLDLSVVETADVTDPYKKATQFFLDTVRRGPQAVVRNPEIAAAEALMKPISPKLGDIVQGYLGGNIPDLRAALKKLSDDNSANREQALAAAKAGGANVSLDDYAFTDWKAGEDYVYA
ncbi:extracellular solute-binding protein [Kineococcus sp. R8]|uniref:ABC transporter substrate-binding protein n=1 Tax=Kineococcus siccus TaxID=2696567 RepID=UPI00141290CE|nr:extracellular solute-binding protein [Kineococcus siccus]NAZ82079.1 extracellular solute-binding protein [Kineococcus siccus]